MSAIVSFFPPSAASSGNARALLLPAPLAHAIWRGDELGREAQEVMPTGWQGLDDDLAGGGWAGRAPGAPWAEQRPAAR